MNLRRTLLFCFLFALVTGIALYQTRLEKQLQMIAPDEVNRNVFFGNQDTIERVEILDHGRKTETVLNKENGQWYLESPVLYPADAKVAEGVAVTARMASRQPRLRGEKEWDEYGLAKPEIEVRIDVPKKKAETLFIGSPTPFGNAFFARWDSERGYLLLARPMKEVFDQAVYGLREKHVFRTPVGAIRKIYVEMGPRCYQWKKDGGQWYWMEPLSKFGEKMPSGDMDRVLAALQNLYVKKFLDDNTRSRAELGFFIIHDRIKVDSDSEKSEIFHFGNEVPLENAYYGFRENEGTVFLIDRGKIFAWIDLLHAVANETGAKTGPEGGPSNARGRKPALASPAISGPTS